MKSLTQWIKSSPKHVSLLKAIYQQGVENGTTQSRASILNVCITRWVENIDVWERFSLSFPFLIEMCEAIVYRNSGIELFSDTWPADNKKNALAHMKSLESFEFVYALISLQRSLLYVKEAVVALQVPG